MADQAQSGNGRPTAGGMHHYITFNCFAIPTLGELGIKGLNIAHTP